MWMQRVLAALSLTAALCFGTAAAGEPAKRTTFMEELFSVEIPAGWKHLHDEDSGVLFIIDNDGGHLMILPPNPALDKDHAAEFTETFLGLFVKDGGELEVGEMEETEFKGHDAMNAPFTMADENNGVVPGIVNVVMFPGRPVIMVAYDLGDKVGDFLPKAAEVMKSYEIDLVKLEEMEEDLAVMGERFIKDVGKALEELEEDD